MRRRDGSPNLKKIALILTLLIFSTGCSEAVLNADQCSDARNAVKRFYSFHFGNDMTPSDRGLEIRTRFLSKGLADRLTKDKNSSTDFFTQSEEFPTAFRVGKCEMRSEDSALLEVLLFWRSDEIKEQRPILVDLSNDGTSWLIDNVSKK